MIWLGMGADCRYHYLPSSARYPTLHPVAASHHRSCQALLLQHGERIQRQLIGNRQVLVQDKFSRSQVGLAFVGGGVVACIDTVATAATAGQSTSEQI